MRYLVQRNGRIVLGSDTPSSPTYGNPPGLNGYLELTRLAREGVPLDRLLAGATIEAARALRVDSLYGTVEPGKVANLLLLSGDPLATVEAYDAIDLVVLHGRPIDRRRWSSRADAAVYRIRNPKPSEYSSNAAFLREGMKVVRNESMRAK